MTIHTSRTIRIARYIAFPGVSAHVEAAPAPDAQPGHRRHSAVHHVPTLQPTAVR